MVPRASIAAWGAISCTAGKRNIAAAVSGVGENDLAPHREKIVHAAHGGDSWKHPEAAGISLDSFLSDPWRALGRGCLGGDLAIGFCQPFRVPSGVFRTVRGL